MLSNFVFNQDPVTLAILGGFVGAVTQVLVERAIQEWIRKSNPNAPTRWVAEPRLAKPEPEFIMRKKLRFRPTF